MIEDPLQSGRRTATCTAVDFVQLVRIKAEDFARSVQGIEDRLDQWLEANLRRKRCSADLDRLDSHIRAHRGEWLAFLHDPEVPPTNNHAEQMLRPAVITRKVGGCNKNLLGALVHSIL